MKSRLEIMQAATLPIKFHSFREYELEAVNKVVQRYTEAINGIVQIPIVKDGFYSRWVQYTIL